MPTGRMAISSLLVGVLILVFGLLLADIIITTAETSGADVSIGSFAGAQSINDLIPLIYYFVVAIAGVGMIGLGAAGVAGRGPLRP